MLFHIYLFAEKVCTCRPNLQTTNFQKYCDRIKFSMVADLGEIKNIHASPLMMQLTNCDHEDAVETMLKVKMMLRHLTYKVFKHTLTSSLLEMRMRGLLWQVSEPSPEDG